MDREDGIALGTRPIPRLAPCQSSAADTLPPSAQAECWKFDGLDGPSIPRAPVSLCMIARNEETSLADCLRSVADLVAKMVVVDTGSTDRTKELAQQCGAQVFDFPWVDDFAAARNESLRHATLAGSSGWTPTSISTRKTGRGSGTSLACSTMKTAFT